MSGDKLITADAGFTSIVGILEGASRGSKILVPVHLPQQFPRRLPGELSHRNLEPDPGLEG
jgi:hypothetical protein